jgi:glycosyltransferase involved in cell wall biosynthesis
VRTSVVLATCDSGRYLGELLESLRLQTEPPLELVVEDDASKDETPALLVDFAERAPFPVRCEFRGERVGHVRAFERGARRANGDAIAFCDHDDVWSPRKLAVCARELERTGAVLALHTARVVDDDLNDLGRDWPPVGRARVIPPLGLIGLDIDTPGLAMVFRRDLLDVFDFASRPHSRYVREAQMMHDEWLTFIAGVLGSIAVVPEPLVRYRQHGSNVSGWVRRQRNTTLQPAAQDYENAADYLDGCAAYLEVASASAGPNASAITVGAAGYRRAARRWALRAALYRTPGRGPRARMLGRLLATRAYGDRAAGGFGHASLVKDVAAGLAFHVSAQAPAEER